MGLSIIYETEDYAIVDKDCGVLSEGDNKSVLSEFESYLKDKYPLKKNLHAGLPHRLDKPVAGLIICTKKKSKLKEWSGQVISPWEKYYWAIVPGIYNGPKTIKSYISKVPNSLKAKVSDHTKEGYKEAILKVTKLENTDAYSLLEIQLITGRYHQIRAQLAHIGFPIVGDTLYNQEIGTVPKAIKLLSKRIVIKSNKERESFIIESQKHLEF